MKNFYVLMLVCLLFIVFVMVVLLNIGFVGDIYFIIIIKVVICELENDSIDVNMEIVVFQCLVKVGKELNQKNFSIGLKDCVYVIKVSVMMDGFLDLIDFLFFVLDSGGVMGVVLKIKMFGGE